MKIKPQIHIMDVVWDISVKSPFSPENNEEFKLLGGKYDKINNRWLLPRNEESRTKLEVLFGAQSRNVVARVTPKDLVPVGKQLKLGGYVAANWDERQNRVTLAKAGVELLAGGWDDAASATHQTPCFAGPDAVLHIVVKRDLPNRLGLTVVQPLPEEVVENTLAVYPDSDLKTELENRGYRVERNRPQSFF